MRSDRASEVAVIGGGVIGLACGAELARRGRAVVVLERNPAVGLETSSRNSEVIHAGIYYPGGSLKAASCVEGRDLLYARCERYGMAHARVGKLIVATTEDQLEALGSIARRATDNGAGGIALLDAGDVQRLEPRIRARGAVLSPNTGIVDAHGVVRSYQVELEVHGGRVVLQTTVEALTPQTHGWSLETRGPDGQPFTLDCEFVVNAAGLAADRIAERAGIDVDTVGEHGGWRIRPCKGDYFSVAPGLGRLADRLIYPVPSGDGGLGVHLTVDLGGRFKLGPDAHYLSAPEDGHDFDYRVDPDKAGAFAEAVRRFAPEIEPQHLAPDLAGIRPKLQGLGEPFRDFVVAESSAWRAPGMVHLVGIESPGLTASGALARRAADLIDGRV